VDENAPKGNGKEVSMFSGTFEPKLDEKGRMILPAKLRELFQGGLFITKGQEGCLYVYTVSYFNELVENIDAASLTNAAQRSYLRLFLAGASNELPDRQGRININPALRKYAGLGRDLTLIGVRSHLEIWDTEAWNKYQEAEEAAFSSRDGEVIPGIF
jgi:MraZ protein